MNKRNYNYKTVSKAWKKKKAALKRKKRPALPKLKKNQPINMKIGKSFKRKVPGLIILASLIAIILVVPTLIVLPGINKDDNQLAVETNNSPDMVELTAGDSPFSVAVKRTGTDQVEDVPLETYVAGVVAAEMPAEFELEALKAQAIAARTYVVNELLHRGQTNQAVTDTVSHQVYKNESELREQWGSDFNWKMNKINKAVAATKGEILTYNNAPIFPAFFSTSNGYTENSEDYWKNKLPYLRSVKSPWDKNSPKFLDQKIFTIAEVEKSLGIDLDEHINIEISRTESNRVDQLKIAGKTFSGRDIRKKLELRSTDFTIEHKNDHLIFTTKGFGHGVGMSQFGANGMAKEGKSYKEILKHYYQDVSISKVTETAPTLVSK